MKSALNQLFELQEHRVKELLIDGYCPSNFGLSGKHEGDDNLCISDRDCRKCWTEPFDDEPPEESADEGPKIEYLGNVSASNCLGARAAMDDGYSMDHAIEHLPSLCRLYEICLIHGRHKEAKKVWEVINPLLHPTMIYHGKEDYDG